MAKGVTREAVVEAALAVLDDVGLEGFTARAIADRLGVKAPALYWHVRDKRDLVDEMGSSVWRDIAAAGARRPGDDWRAALARFATATRTGLLAHRDGARTFSGTYLTDPAVLQGQEGELAWMQTQGFDVDAATDAAAIVASFVIGHCIEEQERAQAPDDRYSVARRDERIDAAAHPRVAASGHRAAGDPDERFRQLLGVVLDGVAGLRADAAPAVGAEAPHPG